MRAAAILAALLMGGYYYWQAGAAGTDLALPKTDLPGYYNYLAQGLTKGHLYLPVEPKPELLALPNPWDPKVDDSLKFWDLALYNRRYYLYHGIGPALMAFVPYRLLTKHDLPENVADFAFVYLGYLFALGSMLTLFRMTKAAPGFTTALFTFLALGICTNLPFLLDRTWVYEVAIAGGYFCVSAGLFFLLRGWSIPAGVFLGLAVACRPHLGLIGVLALLYLVFTEHRKVVSFLAPFALIGLALCGYNYARFDNPFQFGNKYILGNANQNEVHWKLSKAKPGLVHLLAQKPETGKVFPWFRGAQRSKDLPLEHAYEPLVGGIWMAPFLVLALLGVRAGPARPFWILLLTSGAGLVFFIAGTGWSVQRYETDFLPLFAMAALLSGVSRLPGIVTVLLVIPGLVVSMVFGFNGPYDEMIRNKPEPYVRIAVWFSPLPNHAPELNPRIRHSFERTEHRPEGTRDVLVGAGPGAARYELRFEQTAGKPTLISQFGRFGEDKVIQELPPSNGPRRLEMTFNPATTTVTVTQNMELVLTHRIGPLITAPSQLYFGEPRY